jgi:hypothetical protein
MADESVKNPRGFEPPPWEADQFEKLARKRAADEEAERRRAQASGAPVAAEGVAEQLVTPAEEPVAPAPAQVAGQPLDAAGADIMLIGLRAEEPRAMKDAWMVTMAAGAPIILMGLAMAVMGVVSMNGAKQNAAQQSMVSGVLVAGALALLGLGGWLVAKSLKTRSIGG